MHEQSTRPRTLAVGLGDSPAGMAAWILEKLIDWTDTGAIGTSFTPYAAAAPKDWPRIEIPTVMTVFPRDLVNAPRQFVERFFSVVDWREFPHGGHFAAWEQPADYVEGVRRALGRAHPGG